MELEEVNNKRVTGDHLEQVVADITQVAVMAVHLQVEVHQMVVLPMEMAAKQGQPEAT